MPVKLLLLGLLLSLCLNLTAQITHMEATGSFSVSMTPQEEHEVSNGIKLGRLLVEKVFEGDLVAKSTGTMLTGMTPTQGSAGYVLIEHVTGTLHGKEGSFLLQHSGLMDNGRPSLTITIIPDSGTGELTGIHGELHLDLSSGTHAYTLKYNLPN